MLPCAQRVPRVSLFGFKLVSETRKTFITSNLPHVRMLCNMNSVQISQNMQNVQKFNLGTKLGLLSKYEITRCQQNSFPS